MAEIRPFRAWRYNPEIGNIKELVSPLFDVVDKEQINELYQNPFNSIHLSVPKDISGVHKIIQQWKSEGIIRQDPLPSIYVYYQYYPTDHSSDLKCCKGFICNIKIQEWHENIILRHESTMPNSVNDRIEVLEKSEMNISPTHGLYTDEQLQLEPYLEKAMENPVYEFTDYQGVINKFGIIEDPEGIQLFIKALKDKQIILADGHHRYTASLEYRKKLKEANRLDPEKINPADYHCMYLSNTENNDLTIYPTHRLIHGVDNWNTEDIIKKLNQYFSVDFIDNPYTIREKIKEKIHSFGVLFKDKSFIIRLKPGAFKDLNWNFPGEVKDLDLTVMHFFIIEKILGVKGKDQKNWKNINFSFNFTRIISEIENSSIQMAIVTRDISIGEIKKICYSGFTFPHKSTYFYPKVVCGILFDSISKEDFY